MSSRPPAPPGRRALPALALFLASALPARGAPQVAEGRPRSTRLPDRELRVPFELPDDRPVPVVEVRVAGAGPFRFFVDTGASVCVLDPALAHELGLSDGPLASRKVADPAGTGPPVTAGLVQLERVELGGASFTGVPALVLAWEGLGGESGARGVLALPLFAELTLTFDYPREELVLSRARLPEEGDGLVAFGADGPLPRIPLRVGGRDLAALVDTGSASGFLLPESALAGVTLAAPPRRHGLLRTLGGSRELRRARLVDPLAVAGLSFPAPEVDVVTEGDTSIGYGVLAGLRLSIDQRGRRLRLERPDEDVGVEDGPEDTAPETRITLEALLARMHGETRSYARLTGPDGVRRGSGHETWRRVLGERWLEERSALVLGGAGVTRGLSLLGEKDGGGWQLVDLDEDGGVTLCSGAFDPERGALVLEGARPGGASVRVVLRAGHGRSWWRETWRRAGGGDWALAIEQRFLPLRDR